MDKRVSQAQVKALKANKGTIKLLILGAGGSGKTTLRKQFTRLYANGFQDIPSRKELRDVIIYNVLEGARVLVEAAQNPRIGGGLKSAATVEAADVILKLPKDACVLDDGIAKALKVLHADDVIQATLQVRSKYQLQECFLSYFVSVQSYPEWGGPSWVPSVDDCVRSRVRSSGIIEVSFELDGQKFKVFDAGGQRAERRKWLHAFDDVTALIFVASLTEYDEVLFEDQDKNRLQESLDVFEELSNSAHFVSTPILIFLNKLDLFEDKYLRLRIPLNVSGLFPDAPAGEPNVEEAVEWISQQFVKRRTKYDPTLIYIHTTTAVDADQVDHVFRDVKEIVLLRSMSQQGLV